MPALRNPRQERFCQLLKQGVPPYKAYPLAGYNQHTASPYRLRDNARIQRRLAELTRHIAMKTRVTVESLTEEFNEAIEIAREVKNPNAVTQAALAKGKLHGLIVDRKETGQPGDFAQLDSVEAIVAKLKQEHGDDAAAMLLTMLSNQTPKPELEPSERGDDEALN